MNFRDQFKIYFVRPVGERRMIRLSTRAERLISALLIAAILIGTGFFLYSCQLPVTP